jgi:hypothetical protein
MFDSLGRIAETLALDETNMIEAVHDVTLACGVSDIADATDVTKIRALARVAALQVAQTTAATYYDFGADGGDYKRSQVMAQLATLLTNAETAAFAYAPNYGLEIGTIIYTADPYDWDLETEAEGVG